MLFAVKKNRETPIQEEEKDLFYKNGYDIVEVDEGKVKTLMSQSSNNKVDKERIAELEKANAELKAQLDAGKATDAEKEELEKAERTELLAKAKELGLNVAHNIGLDTLKERIAEAEADGSGKE